MMRRFGAMLLAAVAGWAVIQGSSALAQERRQTQARLFYDTYEPSQRLRTRRENCTKDEEYFGAHCVRKCRTGYALLPGSKPAKCRSLTPLPAGQLPGPVRKEVGVQPLAPRQPSTQVVEDK